MSSTRMQSLPSTSPMMFITSETPARSRRLSMIARSQFSREARLRARSTPPTSGETIITGRPAKRCWISVVNSGAAYRLSTGMSKKPWIWPACRSRVSTRLAPASVMRLATSLALIGVRGAVLRSCRA